MGFLNDLGLEDVDDSSNYAAGKYAGFVYDAKVVEVKKNNNKSLVLTYRADRNLHPDTAGKQDPQEWFAISQGSLTTERFEQGKTWLKRRLKSLGVPDSRMGSIDPDDLIGTAVDFTVKINGEYVNLSYVETREVSGSTLSAANGGVSSAAEIGAL